MKNFYHHPEMYCIPFVCLFLILFASYRGTSKHKSFSAPMDTSSYQLIWADEFNGTTVDTSNWNFEIGGQGWGNHEQEYYQSGNATVSGGNLVITGKKEDV